MLRRVYTHFRINKSAAGAVARKPFFVDPRRRGRAKAASCVKDAAVGVVVWARPHGCVLGRRARLGELVRARCARSRMR